jgi:hypothetical protein
MRALALGEYPRALCPLQGRQLQVRVLVIRGNATIVDFRATILSLIYDACNLLFLQRGKLATKFLLADLQVVIRGAFLHAEGLSDFTDGQALRSQGSGRVGALPWRRCDAVLLFHTVSRVLAWVYKPVDSLFNQSQSLL